MQRKCIQFQWLQDLSQRNAGIPGTEGGNILWIQIDSKNKNRRNLYGSINEFEKGYQPRNNLVKDKMMICLHTQCNL
jgi:hypothetical protein